MLPFRCARTRAAAAQSLCHFSFQNLYLARHGVGLELQIVSYAWGQTQEAIRLGLCVCVCTVG